MHLNSEVTMFEMTGTIAVSSPRLGARALEFQNAPKFGRNDFLKMIWIIVVGIVPRNGQSCSLRR